MSRVRKLGENTISFFFPVSCDSSSSPAILLLLLRFSFSFFDSSSLFFGSSSLFFDSSSLSLISSSLEMNADTLNLNDDDYLSVEDMMAENEDEQNAQADSVTSAAQARGNKRRHSVCWKNFTIIADKLSDGSHNIKCNHCHELYNIDLGRNGTSTLLRHSRRCSKTPGSTPGSNRKLDMMVFREMMAIAIVEHNLPYAFVEYRRVNNGGRKKKKKVVTK